jgi:hypothetical protein
MAGFQQVRRHRRPHIAEPDKADRRHPAPSTRFPTNGLGRVRRRRNLPPIRPARRSPRPALSNPPPEPSRGRRVPKLHGFFGNVLARNFVAALQPKFVRHIDAMLLPQLICSNTLGQLAALASPDSSTRLIQRRDATSQMGPIYGPVFA